MPGMLEILISLDGTQLLMHLTVLTDTTVEMVVGK